MARHFNGVNSYLKILALFLLLVLLIQIFRNHSNNFGQQSSLSASLVLEMFSSKQKIQFPVADWTKCAQKLHAQFWENIEPSFKCPNNKLSRTGKSDDGGKWTCGLETLAKVKEKPECLVYSFGVNKDSSFEAEVLASTHCDVYAYDMTVNSIAKPLKSTNRRVHFTKMGVAGVTKDDKMTLTDILSRNGHKGRTVLILKIDIEGYEYQVLKQVLKEFPVELPFGQLLVEFHNYNWQSVNSTDTSRRDDFIEITRQLENRGMRMFYREPNMKWLKGRAGCEFSFINTNMLQMFLEDDELSQIQGLSNT